MKENQERRNASGLEGTRQKVCKVAEEFLQKFAEEVDQLTVPGEPEETEHAPGPAADQAREVKEILHI